MLLGSFQDRLTLYTSYAVGSFTGFFCTRCIGLAHETVSSSPPTMGCIVSLSVCVPLPSYSFHSEAILLERRRVTQRVAESESEKVTNQSRFTKKPSTIQDSAQQFSRPRCNCKRAQFPLTPMSCTRKSATSLQKRRIHHTRTLGVAEIAPAFLYNRSCARATIPLHLDKSLGDTQTYAA